MKILFTNIEIRREKLEAKLIYRQLLSVNSMMRSRLMGYIMKTNLYSLKNLMSYCIEVKSKQADELKEIYDKIPENSIYSNSTSMLIEKLKSMEFPGNITDEISLNKFTDIIEFEVIVFSQLSEQTEDPEVSHQLNSFANSALKLKKWLLTQYELMQLV